MNTTKIGQSPVNSHMCYWEYRGIPALVHFLWGLVSWDMFSTPSTWRRRERYWLLESIWHLDVIVYMNSNKETYRKKSYLKFKILIVYISHNNIITSLTCKILTNIGSMTHVNKSTSMHCHFFTNLQALIKFFETILDRTTIHKIISSLEYQLTTSWSHQVNSSNGTRFFFFTWFIARLYTDLLFSYRKNWIVTSICDVYWKYAPSISYQKNLDTSL